MALAGATVAEQRRVAAARNRAAAKAAAAARAAARKKAAARVKAPPRLRTLPPSAHGLVAAGKPVLTQEQFQTIRPGGDYFSYIDYVAKRRRLNVPQLAGAVNATGNYGVPEQEFVRQRGAEQYLANRVRTVAPEMTQRYQDLLRAYYASQPAPSSAEFLGAAAPEQSWLAQAMNAPPPAPSRQQQISQQMLDATRGGQAQPLTAAQETAMQAAPQPSQQEMWAMAARRVADQIAAAQPAPAWKPSIQNLELFASGIVGPNLAAKIPGGATEAGQLIPNMENAPLWKKWAAQASQILPGTAYGIYEGGRALYQDLNAKPQLDPFQHTRQYAGELGKGVVQQFSDPIENLPMVALTVFAGTSAASNLVARAAAAGRAITVADVNTALRVFANPYKIRGALGDRAAIQLTVPIKVGDAVIDVPVSRNAFARRAQKLLNARREAQLAAYPRNLTAPQRLAHRVGVNFTPEAKVGREIRAQARIEEDLAMGPIKHQQQLTGWGMWGARGLGKTGARLRRGLTAGENAATYVLSIQGDQALLDPIGTVRLMIEQHAKWAQEAADAAKLRIAEITSEKGTGLGAASAVNRVHEAVAAEIGRHEAMAAALKLAGDELQAVAAGTARGRFVKALQATAELSNRSTGKRIDMGLITRATAEARQASPSAVYQGGEAGSVAEPPPGSFYARAGEKRGKARTEYPQVLHTATGLGPVRPGAYDTSVTHTYSGESARTARQRLDIPRVVAEQASATERMKAVADLNERMWAIGSDVRRATDDMPVRTVKTIPQALKDQLGISEWNDLPLTPEEAAKLTDSQYEALWRALNPAEARQTTGFQIGEVRWVPQDIYRAIRNSKAPKGSLDSFQQALGSVTNPVRFMTLYLRGGYILNLPANIAILAVTEGVRGLGAMALKAWHADRLYGEGADALISSGMGQGPSLAFGEGFRGMGSTLVRGTGRAWNQVTDELMRKAAFIAEADRLGMGGDRMMEFLTDPKWKGERNAAFRRAKKAAVEYDNLVPAEKDIVRHVVYFWPWISRATTWAGKTAIENPVKTAAVMQMGQKGAEDLNAQLGPNRPYWMKESGVFPTGAGLVNPSSLLPWSTVGQTLGVAGGVVGIGGGVPADVATPGISFVAGLFSKPETGTKGSMVTRAFKNIVASLPQVQALRRLNSDDPHIKGFLDWLGLNPPTEKNVYSGTGVGEAVGPLMGGGVYPRDWSKEAVKEQSKAALSPMQKVQKDVREQASEVSVWQHVFGWDAATTKRVKDAISMYGKLETALLPARDSKLSVVEAAKARARIAADFAAKQYPQYADEIRGELAKQATQSDYDSFTQRVRDKLLADYYKYTEGVNKALEQWRFTLAQARF